MLPRRKLESDGTVSVDIRVGDCLEHLRAMPSESVQCIVTSPPYWGLRNYDHEGQIGAEDSVAEHVEILTSVFREAKRVLRSDGTFWLNYGDAYAGSGKGGNPVDSPHQKQATNKGSLSVIGQLPWRVAFALQDDGWWLRSDIIWSKPNPMPESVTDRPTRSHEYVFLLTKSAKYWYDADAIAEPAIYVGVAGQDANGFKNPLRFDGKMAASGKQGAMGRRHAGFNERWDEAQSRGEVSTTRNARTVWSIATEPFAESHFATFPTELAKRCILASCPTGGTVLDPFGGAGTTGLVAEAHGRNAILIELNPTYAAIASRRIKAGLGEVSGVEDDCAGLEPLPLFMA